MNDYRVLVTGSRDWTDVAQVEIALRAVKLINDGRGRRVVLVHGACRGADLMAAEIASRAGFAIEPHPAIWRPYGVYNPQAGLIRNREMVELGANVCLAFIKNGSQGATHCADLAEAAGIETRRYEVTDYRRPPAPPVRKGL